MTTSVVGIRALQQTASKVVARVAAGESLTVTDRGRPVARLVPIADSAVEQLLAAGSARPARLTWTEVPSPIESSETALSDLLWSARDVER
jgi:prevent-host-death family protein